MADESLDNYNSQESGFEEVSIEEISEDLNKEINTTTKPIFKVNTTSKINGITIHRGMKEETDKKGKEYYTLFLQIKTTTPDGIESVDNYGGLRQYNDGFWNGGKSAFGKLLALAQAEDDSIKTYIDLLRFLPGKEVKVKTISGEFNGNTWVKNVIQSFR